MPFAIAISGVGFDWSDFGFCFGDEIVGFASMAPSSFMEVT